MTSPERRLAYYLNRLPDEGLDNIIRHLSDGPSRKDWMSAFPIDLALQLLSGQGRLSCAARRTLTSLSTTSYEMNSLKPASVREKYTDNLGDVLLVADPALEELHVTCSISPHSWVSTFASRCINLVSLTLQDLHPDFPLSTVIQSCSGRLLRLALEELQLTVSDVVAISRHCRGLRELSIDKVFGDDWRAMWTALGPTLEKLRYRKLHPTGETSGVVIHCLSEMTSLSIHK